MNEKELLNENPNQKAKPMVTADKSQNFMLNGLAGMYIILVLYNLYKGLPFSDINVMFWGYLGLFFVIKYQKERITRHLIGAIGGIVAALAALANYILMTW